MAVAWLLAGVTAEAAPAFNKKITINPGQVTGGPLSDFPLLFSSTDPALRTTANGGKVTNVNGWDIIFATSPSCADSTSCGGNKLDHEIETYNPVTGQLIAWVRVPSLDNGTIFYVHYGDSAVVATTENRPGVWNAAHKGVWHLKETPPALAIDSTLNANNGTPEISPVQTPGQIDGSLQFDGTLDRDVNIPNTASLLLPTEMTISSWARTTSADTQSRLIVAKWKAAGGFNFWLGKVDATQMAFGADGGGASTAYSPLALVNDGAWHQVVGVAEAAGTLRIYVDGVQRGTAAFPPPIQTGTSEVRIGRSPDVGLQDWAGGIDEVRVSNVARSPGWIQTEYRNQSSPSTFYSVAGCCSLSTAAPGDGTVTVTGLGSFRLRFNTATGAGIDRFYDLEEDALATTDLAGGDTLHTNLFIDEIVQGTGPFVYYFSSAGLGAKLDLLEATSTRVRVRQGARFSDGSVNLADVFATGDYSIYGPGRMALSWNRWKTPTATVNYDTEELQLITHYGAVPPLNSWASFHDTGALSPLGPAGSSFLLTKNEATGARTDFLQVFHPPGLPVATQTIGDSAGADIWQTLWRDNNTGTIADTTFRWLTYFKPTGLGNTASPWLDPAVTTRRDNYLTPSTTTVTAGAGWVDASENTAADPLNVFYNEAEAVYVFDLDPATGLTFAMDGSATPHYAPFFKIRQWRSLTEFLAVTFDADGPGGAAPAALSAGVSYRAAVKPIARAHFAQDLLWHSSLQDAASVATPDVGTGVGSATGVTFPVTRYGRGVRITGPPPGQAVSFPIAASGVLNGNFDKAKGALEFWFQPAWDHDDGVFHDLAGFGGDSANAWTIRKLQGSGPPADRNALMFWISAGANSYVCQVAQTNYRWRANDWVHLRFEWDDTAPTGTRQRILINGVAQVQTVTGDYDSTLLSFLSGANLNARFFIGDDNSGGGNTANAVFDEVSMYGGSATTPRPLASGGLTSDANEYLADISKDFTLSFAGIDASNRGKYFYIGTDSKFRGLNIALSTPGVGVAAAALQWQYWAWDGVNEGWADLELVSGFADTTNSMTKNGSVSWGADPANWTPYSVNGGPDLYYLRVRLPAGSNYTTAPTESLIKTDILLFQYCSDVTAANQTFAFAVPPTTAVKLASFTGRGLDSAVSLEWETASELDNLGFHLYRAPSAEGPWTRLTKGLVPGLGSSPEGKRYSWQDSRLENGTTYFYRLEDIDRSGLATSHGPVWATPGAGLGVPAAPPAGGASADASTSPGGAGWQAYGEPSVSELRVLKRTRSSLTLELTTGGFYARLLEDGTARLHVPGSFELSEPGLPQLPTRRAWVEVPAGSGVRVASILPSEVVAFRGLVVGNAGAPQAVVDRGTYRAAFRRVAPRARRSGLYPELLARVLETAFQGETKKAYVEFAPLRVGASGQLWLARKLVVRLTFQGRASGERSRGGSRGRLQPGGHTAAPGRMLARLATRSAGLHAVSFESVMSGGAALSSASLRLSRLGRPVAFHLEPSADRFHPGSTLYFMAEGPETAYANETVYELAIASGGAQMPVGGSVRNAGSALVPALVTTATFEQNTNYLPGLLNARDPWLWDIGLLAPNGRDYPFTLSAPNPAHGPARLSLDLQGGSDAAQVAPDHQVRVFVNGLPLGEVLWDGLNPVHFEASFDVSILSEGENTLRLEDLDTTGRFDSVVYLDRFAVEYPRTLVAAAGRLDGRAASSGLVQATGFASGARLVDLTAALPRWLTPATGGGGLTFTAEAGSRYLAVAPEALGRPELRAVSQATLREPSRQADWIVIAPQELLPAAEPLVARRESQGLRATVVSLEQVQDEFGYGERSPQMLRDFLVYAYHQWKAPSVRFVLLLGDASYDPKGFLATAKRRDLLPTPFVKSAFLWTASDPSLAAVNGEDAIPDLAIGRLSAGTLAEAEAAVGKILAFEQSGQSLDGTAVLVADNPDRAGDFEANANDIASLLRGRQVERIFLSQLGSQTRGAVLGAFDAGASLVSYVGHGSQALWASEAILRSVDVALLQPQPRQPLLLTMTCSNGYFISPFLNGISERFVLEADKGAIAAFSPSGLSLDAAAHIYHRALVQELASGRHERLGDLVLAAQKSYADTGAFPELLSLYHLFGDPALKIPQDTRE